MSLFVGVVPGLGIGVKCDDFRAAVQPPSFACDDNFVREVFPCRYFHIMEHVVLRHQRPAIRIFQTRYL